MHIPNLDKHLSTLFGGVKPHMLLSFGESRLFEPEFDRAQRASLWPTLGVLLLLIGIGVGGAFFGNYRAGPPRNPIINDAGQMRVLSLTIWCASAGCWCWLVVGPLFTADRLRAHRELHRAYYATQQNWLFHREMIFWSVLCLSGLGLGAMGVLRAGTCIDENGLRRGCSRTIPYNQVAAINTYGRFNAPAGRVYGPNMVVHLKNGSEFRYQPDPQAIPAPVDEVAAYVSARSGVPVVAGDMRP